MQRPLKVQLNLALQLIIISCQICQQNVNQTYTRHLRKIPLKTIFSTIDEEKLVK